MAINVGENNWKQNIYKAFCLAMDEFKAKYETQEMITFIRIPGVTYNYNQYASPFAPAIGAF